MRIVSLVPSLTELLYDLGLHNEIVGITKFCVHPDEWHLTKQRVGGTKNVHMEIVKALHPSLIIASKEENVKDQIEEMNTFSKVLVTDVKNFDDALQVIIDIGILTGKTIPAKAIADQINAAFKHPARLSLGTAAYFIWKEPWMTVGGDTYIHSVMEKAGFENITASQLRYPEITIEQLKNIQPRYILLSSEPYPFKEAHVAELQKQFASSKVIRVDGEMFSWYGSRMLHAAAYFNELYDNIQQYNF